MTLPDMLNRNDSHINELELDEFEFRDYVKPLVDRLFSVLPPFTVGVFGGWGSGKTSLMSLLRRQIETGDRRAVCIWFDAWKFDREETVWRAFLVHTLNAISEVIANKAEKAEDEKRKELEGFLASKIEPLRQQLYRSFQKSHKGALKIDWEGLPKKLLLFLAQSFLPGVNLGTSLIKLFKGESDGSEEDKSGLSKENIKTLKGFLDLIQREETKEHFEHIRFIDQFDKEFKELIDKVRDLLDIDRLAFFIDDLDRCLPEQAIQVLEAIKLFLSNEYCVFVVGIDEEVIHAGLDVRYQHMLNRLGPYEASGGDRTRTRQASISRRQFQQEYLEKIIQLPFTLPPLPYAEVREFISSRLNIDDPDRENIASKNLLIELMTQGCEYNPRKLKRVCYLFNLNWELATQREIQDRLNPDIIVKLVILQLRARPLYQALIQGRSALLPLMERYWQELETAEGVTGKRDSVPPDEKGADKTQQEKKDVEPHHWIRPYVGIEWLKEFLLWQPPKGATLGECTRFNGLKNIEEHIQLKATSALQVVEMEVETRILQDLLHEDLAIIESACNKIADQVWYAYQQYLLEFIEDPANPWRQRVSSGDALGFVGDPRFDGERPWEEQNHWADIAAGEFYRGSLKGDKDANDNEIDGGKYTLDGFQIARYQVTNEEYQRFVVDTSHQAPSNWTGGEFPTGKCNHPVVRVSSYDAQAYIEWLNGLKDGHTYFLPTEAQWERAARGMAEWEGKENRRRYPCGDEFDPYKCNVSETGLDRTMAVGCFADGASPEGVLDMAGNVFEWCADWYDGNYYQKKIVEENKNKSDYKVLRGGSFSINSMYARCAYRNYCPPDYNSYLVSFRVARI